MTIVLIIKRSNFYVNFIFRRYEEEPMEPEVEVSIADFHLFSCLYVGLLILDFPRSHLPLQFIQRCDSCFF